MMKIRPYPGKIALIQNQDGVEKEVTMNYESNWQECLQLWGSQNAYAAKNGHYNGAAMEVLAKNTQTSVKNQVNGCVLENVNYTDYDALYSGNEPVSSHSFNYFNNFAGCDATNIMTNYMPMNGSTDEKANGTRTSGRQRYFPQMLEDNPPVQNGYQPELVAGCSVEYVNPPQVQNFPSTDTSSWVIPETVPNGVQNGLATTNHYPYKNHRKLYRTPTMIDKNVALPYVRDVEVAAAAAAAAVPMSDNGFLIPRPKLIVPVHTYGSRKRRTGNILHSKRRGSDTEPCSTSTAVESKKHHTSCPGKRLFLRFEREMRFFNFFISPHEQLSTFGLMTVIYGPVYST